MSNQMQIGFRVVDGLQIRFAKDDTSSTQRIVPTSPWPESLLAFERVWPRLSAMARLTAVDLPGFGRSEARTELFSPIAMSQFLIRLLDDWDIEHPHLVSPDVGTAAALFAAANNPGRLRSLVVGGGGIAFPLQLSGALRELIEAQNTDAFRRRDPRDLVNGALTAMGSAAPRDDVVDDYIESNAGGRFAEAARYGRSYPQQLGALADLLGQIFSPVQIIAGRNDPLVPLANAEYLHVRLPNSQLDVLDAGHFVWEEAADAYGSIIAAWVTGGYLVGSAGAL